MGRSFKTGSVPHTSVRIHLLTMLMLICAVPLRGTAQTSASALQSAAKTPPAAVPEPYHVVNTIPLSFNPPPLSALAFDPASRRLFIPAANDIYVVAIDSGALVGQVRKVGYVSDIAFAPEINRGFAEDSFGRLIIFDLQTYAVLAKPDVGGKSFALAFDPITKQVFTTSLANKDCKVFDAMTGKLVKIVKLGGYPFGGVADSTGRVYFELSPDALERWTRSTVGDFWGPVGAQKVAARIVSLDTRTLKLAYLWSEPSCTSIAGPHGIGIDLEYRRLVVACENSVDSIDADSGKIISAIQFHGHPILFSRFSASLRDVFVLAEKPLQLIILHEASANTFIFAGIIAPRESWNMAFDGQKTQFFTLKCDAKSVDSGFLIDTKDGMEHLKMAKPVPGTFRIVVYVKN